MGLPWWVASLLIGCTGWLSCYITYIWSTWLESRLAGNLLRSSAFVWLHWHALSCHLACNQASSACLSVVILSLHLCARSSLRRAAELPTTPTPTSSAAPGSESIGSCLPPACAGIQPTITAADTAANVYTDMPAADEVQAASRPLFSLKARRHAVPRPGHASSVRHRPAFVSRAMPLQGEAGLASFLGKDQPGLGHTARNHSTSIR